jgi:ABC-type multidrug transport system ATPase subunit
MNQGILQSIVRLFAIFSTLDEDRKRSRELVYSFLLQQLNENTAQTYLSEYDQFISAQENPEESIQRKKKTSAYSVKVLTICERMNAELSQKQKIIVLARLMEIIYDGNVTETETDFIETVTSSFNIPDEEYLILRALIEEDLPESSQFLIRYTGTATQEYATGIHELPGLQGNLFVAFLPSCQLYLLTYRGKAELSLNGQLIQPDRLYILNPGSVVRSSKFNPLYFSEIENYFLRRDAGSTFEFKVDAITFAFKSGRLGLQELSFSEQSGRMIGIMGGSGAGKSTLLNVLNGNEHPSSGKVTINGINLHHHEGELNGVIGFVPQEDLLIESLTVFENLFYNARLCLSGKSAEEITNIVDHVLNQLGLSEVADLKVGSALHKTISGGQRKRVNIALELLREPAVLFLDEPTSGLSSRDSEIIIDILKGLARRGKLVFIVIHQPSSEIFKLFDRLLLLDTGGYPIYYGNPVESLIYFKQQINHVGAAESECSFCGNVNPEQLFSIIEAHVLDEYGNLTRQRKILPEQWYRSYKKRFISLTQPSTVQNPQQFAGNTQSPPGKLLQWFYYLQRDLASKIANTQYLTVTLLEGPILAALLAFIIRFSPRVSKGDYAFYDNPNIPAYLFMCVLVSLFFGMIGSAEEIFSDRKILKREKFLNLSWMSYLSSKIAIQFLISAIQALLFVWVGNLILGIQGMYFSHVMLFFTASCFANLLGLTLSASFRSAVTIYILIPLLLIPQILLAGVIVKFENLNPLVKASKNVPWIANLMPSRWIFEAMAVEQFISNAYEKPQFSWNSEIEYASFIDGYWSDETIDAWEHGREGTSKELLASDINQKLISCSLLADVHAGMSHAQVISRMQSIRNHYNRRAKQISQRKDAWIAKNTASPEKKKLFLSFKNKHENKALGSFVKNELEENQVVLQNGAFVPNTRMVYFPYKGSNPFQAGLFVPSKVVGGFTIGTFCFNLAAVWGMTILLFGMLYYRIFPSVFNVEGKRRKQLSFRGMQKKR